MEVVALIKKQRVCYMTFDTLPQEGTHVAHGCGSGWIGVVWGCACPYVGEGRGGAMSLQWYPICRKYWKPPNLPKVHPNVLRRNPRHLHNLNRFQLLHPRMMNRTTTWIRCVRVPIYLSNLGNVPPTRPWWAWVWVFCGSFLVVLVPSNPPTLAWLSVVSRFGFTRGGRRLQVLQLSNPGGQSAVTI